MSALTFMDAIAAPVSTDIPSLRANDPSGDEDPARRRPNLLWGDRGDPGVGFAIGTDGKCRLVVHPES